MHKLAATFVMSLSMATTAWAESQEYVVDSVKDGDTILISVGGNQVQLQLLGIDAPEDVPNPKLQRDMQRTKLAQDKLIGIGKLSSKHLSSLAVPGQTIKVDADLSKKDRYGRVPAIVTNTEGRNLNLAMVEDGYAVVMGKSPFDEKLKASMKELQVRAMSAGLGLWGSNPKISFSWAGK